MYTTDLSGLQSLLRHRQKPEGAGEICLIEIAGEINALVMSIA